MFWSWNLLMSLDTRQTGVIFRTFFVCPLFLILHEPSKIIQFEIIHQFDDELKQGTCIRWFRMCTLICTSQWRADYNLSNHPKIFKNTYGSPGCRTEQNIIFIGVKSIYKGLLPKQHIKYKTKRLLNAIKLHIHVWNAWLPNNI